LSRAKTGGPSHPRRNCDLNEKHAAKKKRRSNVTAKTHFASIILEIHEQDPAVAFHFFSLKNP
jgi:hypothetical protein